MMGPAIKRGHFNPRTHGECDKGTVKGGRSIIFISIHALTGSATFYRVEYLPKITKISIHALTGSATVFFSHYLLLKNTANHFLKSFVSFFFVFCELGLGFLCPGPSLISFTISTSLFLGYRYRPFPDFPLFSPNFFQDYKFL